MSEEIKKNDEASDEVEIYTLSDEDGNEEDYIFVADLELDGVKYIALSPES